ncbi:MAG: polysaccharide deacetylase family protein [Phycisphaerales bacterium]|nr:polysaccharide deacetylase family protein [Phycisphaerales bacterium]MCI0630670.1 polysaccharide deacetylase family protein [Phycisphaerales bacterium]MCI0675590.1 polysaccharide deacetylase family protein [Phycisphaerales bacterium]
MPKATPNGSARQPLVLLYHSVSNVRPDPFGIRVSPRNFSEQMAVLAAHARPVPFTEIDRAIRDDHLPEGAVAVTFDDGYADNLLNAKPVLERYGIPATVFISTGYIGSDRDYWWDELDRLVLSAGRLPRQLRLEIDQCTYEWDLESSARYNRIAVWGQRQWKVWHRMAPTGRHVIYSALWQLLRVATLEDRENALEQLRDWAGTNRTGRSTHRSLTVEELKSLADGDLIEIGGHTVNHPSLGAIDESAQRSELCESKRWLEGTLDREVTSFSYPYGSRDDYSAQTVELTKASGYRRACTNVAGVIKQDVDQYQYPRRVVQDWDGRTFLRWLRQWFSETAVPLLFCATEQVAVFA